jgi:predicted RNA-binding protein YlqC (UPF0109 family)
MEERDQKFVEMVVKEIVDNPNDVKVERIVDDRGVLLTLSINPEDMGKVIGKEGKTAEALRTLLRIIGAKNNARVNLKILEPEGSENNSAKKKEEPVTEEKQEVANDMADDSQPMDEKEPETTPIEEENATEIL